MTMQTAEQLKARLAELDSLADALTASVIRHGERAALNERRASERKAIHKAVRRLRRVAGRVRVSVTPTIPMPDDAPFVPRRTVTRPHNPGAP